MYDITATVCLTSYTLYKASRPHFMTSHHIIYDITCSVLMTSLPRYLTLHPLYLCHHNPSIYDLLPTVYMTSHPVYILHLMHRRKRHIHSLWLHTIVVTTLHPLHSWHHTDDKTIAISAISPTVSYTTSTLSVSSNPVYQINHTHSLDDIKNTICMTSYSVCMA